MKAPYFSVVTPSYNQGPWLEGCIKSVLAQGGNDFEHIVVDNCSEDESREIAGRYPHLRWHSERDRGQSDALNKAIAMARGEILCWLNADDEYPVETFARLRQEFQDPATTVIFGDAREIYFDGRPPAVRRARFERREDLLVWWEKRTDILQPAVFMRLSAAREVGPLREDLHFVMDTEFWWRLSAKYSFRYVPEVLAIQQRQPESKTISQTVSIYAEKERVFGPLLPPTSWSGKLTRTFRRRRMMGRRYLGLGQSAGAAKSAAAWSLLWRALRENPLLALTPGWWKAVAFAGFSRSWRAAETRAPAPQRISPHA